MESRSRDIEVRDEGYTLYSQSPSPPLEIDSLSQHQHGVDVSHQPNWPRQFGHQYAHSPIYFQDQMPYVNANWQMTAAAGHAPPPPPDTQHYGYFAPGFSQPFYQAESNAMMYPTHQPLSGVQGYHHHPSWSSLVSSTGSIGSVGSSGHSSSMRRRSTKRQVKKKHHNMANSVETRYDGETLFSMQSRIVSIAKDQEGSRFIQQRLECADQDEIQLVFDEAIAAIEDLWNDVYGNFILQKLLEFGTDDMKESIANRLASDSLTLSTRVYGCRVIQKALDELTDRDVANLISTFHGNAMICLNDHNGNHVIQKSISILFNLAKEAREKEEYDLCSFYLESLDPIIDEIIESVEELSQHPYGCRAVQRMVEHCIEPQRTKILDSIIACQQNLLSHTYGNYVVQKVLTFGRTSDKDAIFRDIIANNNFILFSKQKQASNVVEAMLRLGDVNQRHQIVQAMMNCIIVNEYNEPECAAISMAKDPYANYVVNTALKVLERGQQRDELFHVLQCKLDELEVVQFAKQIVATIKTK